MGKWEKLADEKRVDNTVESLRSNGLEVFVVDNGEEARKKVLELLPLGAEVMTATSITIDTIGVSREILESGKYDSVRNKLDSMDRKTQGAEMKKLGATPQYILGSVHAVTEDGKVLVASASGSQLPAYSYGSNKVIWVVGTQKIVKNMEECMKRIYEHSLPLESERARKVYGIAGSSVNKLFILNKESQPGRITMILVKERLGF